MSIDVCWCSTCIKRPTGRMRERDIMLDVIRVEQHARPQRRRTINRGEAEMGCESRTIDNIQTGIPA